MPRPRKTEAVSECADAADATPSAVIIPAADATSSPPHAPSSAPAKKTEAVLALLARETGRNDFYVTRLVRMAFLSPQVIEAILECRQHADLTARMLRDPDGIPTRWEQQAAKFLPRAS